LAHTMLAYLKTQGKKKFTFLL